MRIFNIFAVELLQNIPFIVGGLIGLYGWHNGSPYWGTASFVLGSLGCAWLIDSLESYKVRWTRLVIDNQSLSPIQHLRKRLIMTSVFTIGLLLICIYLEQGWAGLGTDLLIVIGLAAVISFSQVAFTSTQKVPRLRIVTHTLSFMVAGMVVLPMLRFVMWTSSSLWGPILWAIPIAFAMSLLIAVVDYTPFLNN